AAMASCRAVPASTIRASRWGGRARRFSDSAQAISGSTRMPIRLWACSNMACVLAGKGPRREAGQGACTIGAISTSGLMRRREGVGLRPWVGAPAGGVAPSGGVKARAVLRFFGWRLARARRQGFQIGRHGLAILRRQLAGVDHHIGHARADPALVRAGPRLPQIGEFLLGPGAEAVFAG